MTSQSERPAAICMDRLSDRMGALVPGSSRWPARHPVKVSLVMGLLGLCSGWGSMALSAAVTVLRGQPAFDERPTFLVSGVLLAVVVALPWAAWAGVWRRWFLPLAAYCVIGNYASYSTIDQLRHSHNELSLFVFGFLTGLYLSVAGLCLTRRFRPVWLIATAVLSGAGVSSFLILRNQHLLDQMLTQQIKLPLIVAWFFSLLHTPSALCLGFLLWDTTPPPKIEPDDELSWPPANGRGRLACHVAKTPPATRRGLSRETPPIRLGVQVASPL